MTRIIAVLALVALAACGESTGPVAIVGTWNLSTVDGQAIPFRLLAPTATSCGVDVQSGQYILVSGGTYSGSEHYGVLVNGTLTCAASYSENGSWAESNGVVTIRNAAGGQIKTLSLAGSGLTRALDGHTYAYHK